jgi:hypothetical protein
LAYQGRGSTYLTDRAQPSKNLMTGLAGTFPPGLINPAEPTIWIKSSVTMGSINKKMLYAKQFIQNSPHRYET